MNRRKKKKRKELVYDFDSKFEVKKIKEITKFF